MLIAHCVINMGAILHRRPPGPAPAHLQDRAPANAGAEVTQVHNTRMLSLLTALLPVISRMGHIEPQLADSMCQDLGELIRNSLWPLVSGTAQSVCVWGGASGAGLNMCCDLRVAACSSLWLLAGGVGVGHRKVKY